MKTHIRLHEAPGVALHTQDRCAVSQDTWIRLAMVYDFKTGRVKTYVDGELTLESKYVIKLFP